MNKEKKIENPIEETLINNSKNVEKAAKEYLANRNFIKEKNEIDIKVVNRYREPIELIKKDSEGKDKDRFYLYVVQWEYTNPEMQEENSLIELGFLVEENEKGEIVNINTLEDLIGIYELEKVQESITYVKENNIKNENKPEEQQDEDFKKDNLKELEKQKEEKEERETDEKKEKAENEPESKKRKPQRVLETFNPDESMDYWQTLRKAFGLPPQVATLAFAYPVSSEDKVDYANITIYMLDKDGYIINDLKVDDYFKFDSSTGNNPINDKTKRLEKDENRGQTQLTENNTMVRLEAVHPNAQHNTYISIEQINGIGDYRDINVGRQTLHTTDYVEKQVVTDRVRRDYDSEAEKLMKSNGGQYKLKDIYKEAEQYKPHGKEYIDVLDADGEIETFNCIEEQDWKELATKWGYYKNGRPDEEKARRVYEEYKYNNPHLSDDELVQEVSDDLYDQTPGGKFNR